MAKFIEVHFVLDGTPRLINVDSIFGLFPSVREESRRIDNPIHSAFPKYAKIPYDCTRIQFIASYSKEECFDARETYDELREIIKSVGGSTTIIEERDTNNHLDIDDTKRAID